MNMARRHMVKLGGSLLEIDALVDRFAHFCQRECARRTLLLVGGGRGVDLVRHFDTQYQLDEKAGHWLALRVMHAHAHLTAAVLPNAKLVEDLNQVHDTWRAAQLPIVDPVPWVMNEESAGITIPHRWQFTSDSIAAHLAHRIEADRLTLLKSTLPPERCSLLRAAALGLVDNMFPDTAADLPEVRLVNLRQSQMPACSLC